MVVSRVSCDTFQDVPWLHWSDCLYDDVVAVFRFQLLTSVPISPYLNALLQPDEAKRADRYFRHEDRQRFIYARSILRILSGNYINQSPEQIRFTIGRNKKPMLAGDTGWHINVSHSGNWILLAIGKVSVGVDVEKIDLQFAFQDILPNSFGRVEQDYIEMGTHAHWRFYQLWTRKEALLKATGKGMDDDFCQVPSLDGFHMTESRVIGETGSWLVKSFSVSPDYLAAVAYQATVQIPKFYTIDSGLFIQ
jgi:4'-phosphopantetheinyl transferase